MSGDGAYQSKLVNLMLTKEKGAVIFACQIRMNINVTVAIDTYVHMYFIYVSLFLVFIPFRSCYYLLYQCLVPDIREALSLLVQHYSVPKDFERSILSGENPRVCNQGILNYLLIMLRRDKNFVKFWNTLRTIINHPELKFAIEKLQKSKCRIIVYL